MKLIVGLGNPGKKYELTRHNIGFIYLDKFSQKFNISYKEKFEGLIGETNINGEKVLIVKPQTFMNLSGTTVFKIINFYNLDLEDMLIIYDDLDLNFGTIKLKINSSAGGHNGMKDIINKLKTQELLRIKFGILNEFKKDTKDFVLSNFSKNEQKEIDLKYQIIENIFLDFINLKTKDNLTLLNKYN